MIHLIKNKSRLLHYFLTASGFLLVFSSCKTNKLAEAHKTKTNSFRVASMEAPPGMVYVPSGTFELLSPDDSTNQAHYASVSAFFIDKAEVTNKQYRQFVDWVADSVAITDYLGDDSYFLPLEDGSTNTRPINWAKVGKRSPLWKNGTEEEIEKLREMTVDMGGKRMLDPEKAKYRFYYTRMVGGVGSDKTVETVGVMPKLNVWSVDFPNAQMQMMDDNYFDTKIFDDYPVVGVSWKQARAFTDWRAKQVKLYMKRNVALRDFNLAFSLPTEIQWRYAAQAKSNPADTTEGTMKTFDDGDEERLALNFKQGEGTYSMDGAVFTLPVKSYAPNALGIYNMAGNVSEWALDAYSPSYASLVNDINPVLLYDVPDSANPLMKRKVVCGGSWKDNGGMLNTDARSFEEQDKQHAYIGFRCVMEAIEIPGAAVKTRRYKEQ
ncbi:gliding motility-associated lipoprotein GldK [bacterium A37T11]|nr:gliding motility-associated lipoprotein GldK [bacterium A37T11]